MRISIMELLERLKALFTNPLDPRIETTMQEIRDSNARDWYRGIADQDIEDYELVWIPNYTSSNVDAIAYLPQRRELFIAFRRKYDRPESTQRVYRFPNIDEDLYDDLFSAGSPGGTVWDRLRRTGASYEKL